VEFLKLGGQQPDSVKPIFYYYSAVFGYAFFVNTVFEYKGNPSPSHGLSFRKARIVEDCKVENRMWGSFWRVVDFYTALCHPNAFSGVVRYSILDNNEIGKKGKREPPLENISQRAQFSEDFRKGLTIKQIIAINYQKEFDAMKARFYEYNIHLPAYYELSRKINTLLMLYIASNLSRYSPKLWQDVIYGEESELYPVFTKEYRNYEFDLKMLILSFCDASLGKPYFELLMTNQSFTEKQLTRQGVGLNLF
jgi:hypothetical protein